MNKYAHIVGWGMYVPQKVVTNDDIAQRLDTSDAWIRSRTGIRERRIATERETTASMSIYAAREALDRARISPADVDVVIVATLTPEYSMPATACLVQDALGAKNAGAFDLSAGCSGFVYALSTASSMIKSGDAEVAVVIGAETLSRIVDWEDRATCILFGDGAGAVVLQGSDEPGGVLSTILGSDGAGGNHLIVPAGGSKMPTSIQTVADRQHFIKMNGPEVFRFATRVLGRVAKEACEKAGIGIDDVNLFIPHQANTRIIKSATKYLKMDNAKVYENLDRYGNTSSASIPVALCEAITEGRVKDKDHLVFVGFGAGLTWGAMVVQWGLPVPYQQRQKWYRILRWIYYRWANTSSRVGWFLRSLEARLAGRPHLTPPPEPVDEKSHIPAEPKVPTPIVLPDQQPSDSPNGKSQNGQGHNGAYHEARPEADSVSKEPDSVEQVEKS